MKAQFNKKIATGIMAVLIAVSFIPTVAGACRGRQGQKGQQQGRCDMKGGQQRSALGIWRNPQMVQNLGLTPDQVNKLKEANFSAREKGLALKAEMGQLRLKMDQAFSSATVDDNAVRQLAEKIAAVQGKMSVKRVEARLTMKNVLTPEQIDKMKMLRQGRGQGKGGMNKPCNLNGQGQGMNKKQGRNQSRM